MALTIKDPGMYPYEIIVTEAGYMVYRSDVKAHFSSRLEDAVEYIQRNTVIDNCDDLRDEETPFSLTEFQEHLQSSLSVDYFPIPT